ncbi:pectinesterase-like [Prosopis cineraria]|uniref:pectinesterase-like n=1 Tax=Prosopis cineraria TaxID=364024 RepID=UPI002410ABCE|nr:pectinesterase-like [Prosopis cineraria]XP_054792493.1 pectinesterase-like [Prosopis cineraria]
MTKVKQAFAGISQYYGKSIPMSKKNKKLFYLAFFTFLLLVSIITVAIVVRVSTDNVPFTRSHAVVKVSCSSALYPELCFSAIAAEPGFTEKVSSHKDVIQLSLNITIRAVQNNSVSLKKLQTRADLTKRAQTALEDCLKIIDHTLYALRGSISYLNDSSYHADDLKTLVSSAITDQETCLDGFSHDDKDRNVREGLGDGHLNVERMSSNALAMIMNMTDTEDSITSGKMMEVEEEDGITWPEWISTADRRLLQASTVDADVVVAADGSGNYTTVSEAVAAAPEQSSTRYVISIKAGVYSEIVEVPSEKTNIMFVGDGATTTIITGSQNVVDGSTTYSSATVAIEGDGFLARDITFENTAGPTKHQAVALRVEGDLSAFYRCNFLGYQDTLYVRINRQFFVNCLVEGTVDFIFGNSAVVFQYCDLRARLPLSGQKNVVTAQGRVDPNQNTGIVIQNCTIRATQSLEAANGSVESYLGRPWKEYSRTVIMESYISDIINPAGWLAWNGTFALDTLFYGEYQNTGPGANTSQRVHWQGFRVITSASEALTFTPGSFISGSTWLASTGFPYALGL